MSAFNYLLVKLAINDGYIYLNFKIISIRWLYLSYDC